MNLKSDCILELRNRGPFREVVLIAQTPLIVYPDSTLRLNDNGAYIRQDTQVSYNSLNINVKEIYETTSRDCNFREIGFMRYDRKHRREIYDRPQGECPRQEGIVKGNQPRARGGKRAKFNQFLRGLFFRTTGAKSITNRT